MTNVLLQELSNQDIDWMATTGHSLDVEAGTTLVQPGQPIEALYILLEGALTVSLETNSSSKLDIARLSIGEIIGEIPFLEPYSPSTTVRALTQSRVLTIPRSTLTLKLQDDSSFATHLYRASAVLLANQLEQFTHQLGQSSVINQPHLREAVTVFAELQDSDLDWLIAAGRVQQVAADTVLVRGSRPMDALQILLEGAVVLTTAENKSNLLASAFSTKDSQSLEQEFARLSRGDMLGGTMFVEAHAGVTSQSSQRGVTVRTLRESQILSIPRWRLAAKLLHDVNFAARFYRVMAIMLANKHHAIVQQLEHGDLTNSNGNLNELDNQFLTQVALAEARFEWMLRRIQGSTGSEMQW
ncbi:cyclic nucleotide-binding domain-containing protein [Phormidesmis priestleyi]